MTQPEPPDGRFSGLRLRVARQFNNLTQAELGARALVTSQFIGQVEHGHKQPQSIVIDALADILGFEESFFYGDTLEEFRDDECHFRRRATTPVSVRARVLAHGSLFGLLVACLDELVAMPREDVPEAQIGDPEDTERAAELCRMKWGVGLDRPIKNLTRAVERSGVVVTRFAADSMKVDAFSRAGKRSVIVLNSEHDSNARSRFDLAHEWGHLVGHGGITTGDPDTEKQANRFAGALLLPRTAFAREFPRSRYFGDYVDWAVLFRLKQRWGASVAAIIRRAYDLRLVPATAYHAAYKHLAYKGWLKREPDDLTEETPELIPLCVEQVKQTKGMLPLDVARFLGWKPQLFSTISGLALAESPPSPPTGGKVVSLAGERIRRAG